MPYRYSKMIVALLSAGGGISSAGADDIYWVGYQNGCMLVHPNNASFFHGDNWLNFLVPGAVDVAIFGAEENPGGHAGNPHIVHFGDFCFDVFICSSASIPAGDAVLDGMEIQDGSFVFDMGPGSTPGGDCLTTPIDSGSLRVEGNLRIGTPQSNTTGEYTLNNKTASLVLQNGDISAAELSVGGGGYTFDNDEVWGNGHLHILSGSGLLLEDPNGSYGEAGLATASFGSGPQGADRFGHCIVSGPGAFLHIDGQAQIGRSNLGSLTVENGGEVNIYGADPAYSGVSLIGRVSSSVGQVTVTGSNSRWTQLAQMQVGVSGSGSLLVSDGGSVESGRHNSASGSSGIVGFQSDGHGDVQITGVGSTWNQDGLLSLGFLGQGSLQIDNGGVCTSVEGKVGSFTGSTGFATIDGPGSVWNTSGQFWVGDAGDGTLTIRDGGLVMVGADAFVDNSATSQGTIAFGIGSGGSGLLEIVGNLSIGESSTLEVTLDPGIVPVVGQQYVVVTADAGITGEFTTELLPTEADGVPLAWAVHYNTTNITLSVLHTNPCDADMNEDGLLDFFDVITFLSAYSASEPAGDFNNDGLWNFFDVSVFLQAFSMGCP